MTYGRVDVDFLGGSGLSSPFRDIKILYNHNGIDMLTATVRKDNTQKYLVLLNALRFNVSSIETIKKKECKSYVTTTKNCNLKNNDLGNHLLKKSYYTSMLGQKLGCGKSPLSHNIGLN